MSHEARTAAASRPSPPLIRRRGALSTRVDAAASSWLQRSTDMLGLVTWKQGMTPAAVGIEYFWNAAQHRR